MSSNNNKDNKKATVIDGAPLLLPLEYCTIDRAAEMLKVKIEDIHHWRDIGSISFYYLFGRAVDVEGSIYPAIDVDTSLTEFIEQYNENAVIIDSDAMWLSASHESKQSTLMWDTNYWSIATNNGPINVKGIATGLWQLARSTSKSRLTGVFYMDGGGKERFSADMRLKESNIERSVYLIRSDLVKLYRAIYAGETLHNRYNDDEIRQQLKEQEAQEDKGRRPRTEKAQSDMIKALLACLPDLNEELERNPSLAPSIMDSYLMKKELNPLNLGENNYRNWMDKAKYKPKK
ncbi:hypothetical protein [Vibrio metschnikovii]|uniref:hypothetical protein n=1 Tax=Vibrio metschnikovii TaxID=28172 RepID=UPI00164B18CF|nr:hypothetical protein [Vibrio metschnikovii]MBC5831902.1 hypothetical protein [Vibrio metschnikovii]